MKKLFLILSLFLILFNASWAKSNDEEEEMETLFGTQIRSGGYGGPEVKISPIQDELGVLVGGRGGWIINSTFSIGGGGYGLVTSHKIKNYSTTGDTIPYLRCGWGGVFLEYINSSNKLIHFTANTLIGGGGAVYTDEFDDDNKKEIKSYENSSFFVIEPGLSIEINIVKNFRIAIGASYRFISGLELSKTKNSDIGGITANIIFKFGSF